MIFSVPQYALGSIQIRLTVVRTAESNLNEISHTVPIGHVIVGSDTIGKGQYHWNQMLVSLRKPVAMWHAIRRAQSTQIQNDAQNMTVEENVKF